MLGWKFLDFALDWRECVVANTELSLKSIIAYEH